MYEILSKYYRINITQTPPMTINFRELHIIHGASASQKTQKLEPHENIPLYGVRIM